MIKFDVKKPAAKPSAAMTGKFKLDCAALESIQIEPGQEGFWRRVDYFFTRDSKCAAKIDALISALSKMPKDLKEGIEALKADYRCQPHGEMMKLIKFSNEAFKWALNECDELKRKSKGWFVGGKVKTECREWAKKEAKKFTSKWSASKIDLLADGYSESGKELPEGKFYFDLGYNGNTILQIAKQFKTDSSGHLSDMRNIRACLHKIGADYKVGTMVMSDGSVGITVTEEISAAVRPILDVIDSAINAYKCVDYFLFYTAKELSEFID